jgi:hypothetical protein
VGVALSALMDRVLVDTNYIRPAFPECATGFSLQEQVNFALKFQKSEYVGYVNV